MTKKLSERKENFKENSILSLRALACFGILGGTGLLADYSKHKVPKNLESVLERPVKNNSKDDYALLISGLTEWRHKEDLNFAYNNLLKRGFEKENIFVLDSDGSYIPLRRYPITGKASKQNIEYMFNYLSEKMDEEDSLFVYVTDHGQETEKKINGEKRKIAEISLPEENIDQIEFSKYIEGINPYNSFFLFGPCYSGGFSDEINKKGYSSVASCKLGEVSVNQGLSTNRLFMIAYEDIKNSDSDKDGNVSTLEAFNYMKNKHLNTNKGNQTPVFNQGVYVKDEEKRKSSF